MSINTQDEMPLASVDDFLIEAGSLDKALLPLGFLLAFAFHHQLLSASFLRQREPQLSAVRLQDGQVSSLFAAHGAALYPRDFNQRGLAFIQRYLPQLRDDFLSAFPEAGFGIDDSWENYQKLAKLMARARLGPPPGRASTVSRRFGEFLNRLFKGFGKRP